MAYDYAKLQEGDASTQLLDVRFEVEQFLQLSALRALCIEIAALTMERPARSVQQSAALLADLLRSKLLLHSVTIDINIGFERCTATSQRIDDTARIPLDVVVKELTLSIANEETDELSLGRVELTFDKHETLLIEDSTPYLEVVASLASTAILVSTRERFNDLLNSLAVHLNAIQASNSDSLFKAVEEVVRTVGLRSLVIQMPGPNRMLGSDEDIEIIKRLTVPIEIEEGKNLSLYPASEAGAIIEADLATSKTKIWLLTNQKEFERELTFSSPWRDFLDRLAQITDVAISRLISVAELKVLEQAADAQRGLVAVAVTTGTLLHQIANLTRDITEPTTALVDAYHQGRFDCPAEYGRLLEIGNQSAEQLLGLVRRLAGVTRSDVRRPCSLLDAMNQCKDLFKISLMQMQIELVIDITPAWKVDVPFDVAVFALANLISNARDAIKESPRHGVIRVFAQRAEGVVDCFVEDNGIGVPKEIMDKVFHLGSSGKSSNSGWGLYLVSKSMKQYGGDIQLSQSSDAGTEFKLRFPAATEEDSAL